MSQMTDIADRSARAIAADRNFDAAVTSYIEGFVTWRRTLGDFNKVVSSSARQRIMKNILRLHFGNTSSNPDNGATFERLLCQSNPDKAWSACGPRVLRTAIALAERSGCLIAQQGRHDRRLKILYPTDKWIAQEAERHEVALASLALLAKDRSRFAARPHGSALVARLAVSAGGPQGGVGVTLGEPDEALREIAALDGGLSTVFAVADAWVRGKRPPSHKEIGASFSVSTSQVGKILRSAADRGLIVSDECGKISDASELLRASRRLVAHEFSIYSRCIAPFEPGTAAPVPAPAVVKERRTEDAH
jgi:hypothetical protein